MLGSRMTFRLDSPGRRSSGVGTARTFREELKAQEGKSGDNTSLFGSGDGNVEEDVTVGQACESRPVDEVTLGRYSGNAMGQISVERGFREMSSNPAMGDWTVF